MTTTFKISVCFGFYFLIEFYNLKKNSSFKLYLHTAVIVIYIYVTLVNMANFVTGVLNLDHAIIVLSDDKKCIGRRKKSKFFPLNMQTPSLFEAIHTMRKHFILIRLSCMWEQ